MSLHVLEPGLLTLVVGDARPGRRALGIPDGGPADRAAFALGNALVGNGPGALALELTLRGPVLRAEADVACVVFGAPFEGGRGGATFTLRAGETLRVGGTALGVRAYLCVAGGFDAPDGPVKAGDLLRCQSSVTAGRSLPAGAWSLPPGEVRALPGPQADWFDGGFAAFLAGEYRVSPAADRMGCRLTGPPLARRPGELVSEPVAPGAVQVTNDGRCVVLGVDGQTVGGYPKVAHVAAADLDRVGQLRPGAAVRFVGVTAADAVRLERERRARLRGWVTRATTASGEC